MNKRIKRISIWLVVLSVVTIFGALFSMSGSVYKSIDSVEGLYYMAKNLWHFYLFLPITITSIIFGLYYRKKGYRVRKNIIVGIIFSFLLIVYGSMGFSVSPSFSTDIKYLEELEAEINFDFPADVTIITHFGDNGEPRSYDDYYREYESVVRFHDESNFSSLIEKIAADDRWLDTLPGDLIAFIPDIYYFETKYYDYYMIYCFENNEFNEAAIIDNNNYIFFALNINKKALLVREFSKK